MLPARNDWASTLAGSNGTSFFAYSSVGLSGVMTDLFPIKSNVLTYLKLRGSYSEVGNEPDLYLTIPTYFAELWYAHHHHRHAQSGS